MAGYLGCQLLYMLFDVALNGLFMDWFEGYFLTTRLMVDPYTKESVYVRDLNIEGFKIFLFWVMVFVACIWLVMLYLVSRYKDVYKRQVMMSTNTFTGQAKKIAYAVLKPDIANSLIEVVRHCNQIFGGFITGKLIDRCV